MAIPVCKRALNLFERAEGKGCLQVQQAHLTMARLFLDTERTKEAEAHARTASHGLAAYFGEGHPQVQNAVGLHASTLVRMGRYSEAERRLREVLSVREQDAGRPDGRLLNLLVDLARIQVHQGKSSEASQTCRRALALYRENVGPTYDRGHELMEACFPILLETDPLPPNAESLLRAIVLDRDAIAARAQLDQNEDLLNFVDGSGWTSLQWGTFFDLDLLVDNLLFRKADVSHGCGDGFPALHVAARWGREKALMVLLQKGADVNMRGKGGRAAAHYAAILGHGRTMDLLMSKQVDLEPWDDNEYTPLHYAAAHGHAALVIEFISRGQDVDSRGERTGLTPLQVSVEAGSLSTSRALMFNGASQTLRDTQGRSARDLARAAGDPQMLQLLSSVGTGAPAAPSGKGGKGLG